MSASRISLRTPPLVFRWFSATPNGDIETNLKALESLRNSAGPGSDETINMMSHCANVLRDTGKLDSAAELYEEAESEVRKKYGDFHPHTYSCKANLGTIYGLLGRINDGIPLLREAVEGFKPLAEMYRVPRVQALSYLSILLHRSGKLEEAASCYVEAIADRKLAEASGDSTPGEGATLL